MDDDYIFRRLDMLRTGQQHQGADESQRDGGGKYPPYDNYAHQYAHENAYAGGYESHGEFVQEPLQLDDIGESSVATWRTSIHMKQTRDSCISPILTLVTDKLRWGVLDCLCHRQGEAHMKLRSCINHLPCIRHAHHNPAFPTLHSTLVTMPIRHHPRVGLQVRHGVCPRNSRHL